MCLLYKESISVWFIFSVVRELLVFFNCHHLFPMNKALKVTLHDLEPAGTGTVSRSCSLQLTTDTVHN